MPLNTVAVRPSPDITAKPIATATVGGREYQVIKLAFGDGDTATLIDGAHPLPVSGSVTVAAITTTDVLIGDVAEAAPATDIASSGLNGRLKRIAQRLTSLIALLPAALAQGGGLKTAATEINISYTVTSGGTGGSGPMDTAGIRNAALLVPAEFDGTTIIFSGSNLISGPFLPLYGIDNVAITMTVAANRIYDLPGEILSVRWLYMNTGTVQTGDTVFTLLGRT